MNAFVVCDEPRGTACWLQLVPGPFRYVRWTSSITDATPMRFAMASEYAGAYGHLVNGENRARVVMVTGRGVVGDTEMLDRIATQQAHRMQQRATAEYCAEADGS